MLGDDVDEYFEDDELCSTMCATSSERSDVTDVSFASRPDSSAALSGAGSCIDFSQQVQDLTAAPPETTRVPDAARAPELCMELPSLGSALHSVGRCRPCGWFWKPQGCDNGASCQHCHLCPSGEHKSRRKARVIELRANTEVAEERSQQQWRQWQQPPLFPPQSPQRWEQQGLDSDRGSGEWTWPNANAQWLLRMLPTDALAQELWLRRHSSVSSVQLSEPSLAMRLSTSVHCDGVALAHSKQAIDFGVVHAGPARGVAGPPPGLGAARVGLSAQAKPHEAALSVAPFRPPPGLLAPLARPCLGSDASGQCHPCAQHWTKDGYPKGEKGWCCHLCNPDWIVSLQQPSCHEAGGKAMQTNIVSSSRPYNDGPRTDKDGFAAEAILKNGSSLHELGMCEPCAWFWKPQGCLNGDACRRCHLCPEGETRARRKVKVAALKQAKALRALYQ